MESIILSLKRMTLIVAFVAAGVLLASAENVKHTVARGETLESIAQKYSTTPQAIITLNPDAAQFIYVGMELEIPQATSAVATSNSTSNSNNKKNIGMIEVDNETETSALEKSHWQPTFMIEYGFLPKEDGVSGTNYAYAATLGANYYFTESNRGVFAGARIGYNSASYNQHVSGRVDGSYVSATYEYNSHYITLPINLGYSIMTSDGKWGVTPYAGMDFNFCVAGKEKQKVTVSGSSKEGERKIKKDVALGFRVGLQLRLGGFNVGGSYVIPINDAQKGNFGKDAYLAINIGFGF